MTVATLARAFAALSFVLFLGGCASTRPGVAERPRELLTDWREFGRSIDGRPLRVRTVGIGPRRVLWIGGIHGNEREGVVTTSALPAAFLQRGLADRVTLTMVEDVNPDGSATRVRHNRNRVDLNRNYPARNFKPSVSNGREPLDQPEARALHALIVELRPDLVIVAHSWSGRYFINFDGPAQAIAERFSELSGYPVEASENIHGTPGSLGSFVGIDMQIPILTLEHRNGLDPNVAWERTREALLAVIAGAD